MPKFISDKEFAKFLSDEPLYYKIKAAEDVKGYGGSFFIDHFSYRDKAFKYLCPVEKELQTFKTEFSKGNLPVPISLVIEKADQMPYSFNEKTRFLDFTLHIQGVCQSCKCTIDFLLRAFSDKEWERREDGLTIYIQKIGQYPSYEIKLDNVLSKYLNEEDNVNYKKALVCLSTSYGIGAYAYLRRVIENEIKRIIKDISELEFDNVEIVREAYTRFQADYQMSKIIDVINRYLPASLKELGDNPIRLLYEQLSGGIHDFSDDECVEKAKSIDVLLKYVIRKINEEKYQLNEVKDAIKKLRERKL